ncbi:LysR family transcriptional regulator [Streptomyces sulphureus]|uniref:LysR family transcriptional regulator n=1 Tax=Streptomyces sulphureus TaxID=47758 RepID=UPI0003737431|nr:LysR family transcriptional regulator [Streptomyces sulphureus]
MDLALLRTFLAVHRAGSFTRAAALLGLSQPAVTHQIRTLERQVGRPLFVRQSRGVTATGVGEELAHRVAPHVDALAEITEIDPEEPAGRTLHLAGPPELMSLRVLPALAPLVERGLTLRAAFVTARAGLEGLAAGHYDLTVGTARAHGELLSTTPLWDEEHVLVAAPAWASRLGGPGAVRAEGARLLKDVPVVAVHESLPLLAGYWESVFAASPTHVGAVIVPDLRAVLECVRAGAGVSVLPRYLCAGALSAGEVATLHDPDVPPLRTYFLTARAGTAALPHLARTQDRLLRTAAHW